MLKRFNHFLILLFALSVSACATVDYEAFNANLSSSESSAIVAEYAGSSNMWSATLRLRNSTEGLIYTKTFSESPTVVEVKPGKYSIISGTTSGYNSSGNLPLIAAWYKEFEVGPGEIVNIGKFGYKPFEVKSSAATAAGKVWNAVNSLGLSTKHMTNYVTYQIEEIDDGQLQAALDKNFAQNKSKLVSRTLELRLSEEEFQKIVMEASAPDAEGNLPTLDESREKVTAALTKYIIDSLVADIVESNG